MGKPLLIKDWKKAHRLWSVRLALFWGGLNGIVGALGVLSDKIDPTWFLALNAFGYALIAFARVTKQPGLD